MIGNRRPASLQSRVRAFFDANPHETLDYSDVHVKFGVTKQQARCVVREIKDEGRIEVVYSRVIRAKQPSGERA